MPSLAVIMEKNTLAGKPYQSITRAYPHLLYMRKSFESPARLP